MEALKVVENVTLKSSIVAIILSHQCMMLSIISFPSFFYGFICSIYFFIFSVFYFFYFFAFLFSDNLLEWLGRRFAESGDLLAAKKYFKSAGDSREGLTVDVNEAAGQQVEHSHFATPSITVRNTFDTRNVIICASNMKYSANTRDFLAERCKGTLNSTDNLRQKCQLTKHYSEQDRVHDELTAAQREDYSRPERAHRSANTVIYATPTMGWTIDPSTI